MTPFTRGSALVLLGLVAGLFVGYFGRDLATIALKKEVGLGEVVNLLITLTFAFLIQNYLTKRFGNERAEKDHLIDLIKEAVASLQGVRSSFTTSYDRAKITADDRKAIGALLRNLINNIGLVRETLAECGHTEEEAKCREIEASYLLYKRTITGGSYPTKAYDGDTFNDAETISGNMMRDLNRLRIKLNRK